MYLDDIREEILKDETIQSASLVVKQLKLNDWFVSAGLIRNFIWDHYFGLPKHQLISDIDVIYFDKSSLDILIEKKIESELQFLMPQFNWSVKNQARMHLRNGDRPYTSSLDAMSFWPEIQTSIGVTFDDSDKLILKSPFYESYKVDRVTRNTVKDNRRIFRERLYNRNWLSRWPDLLVEQ